jgi:hypothetical protein
VFGPVRTLEEAKRIRDTVDSLYGKGAGARAEFVDADHIIEEIRSEKERTLPRP